MGFNNSQKRAIAISDGPAMVLAGAGSGKTTVITHRVRSLILEHGVNPSNILVITFTKAAASEMKERYLKLAKDTSTGVTFGTFHAVFFMVLKWSYHLTTDNILPEEKKYAMVKELIRKHRLDARDENELVSSLISDISKIKNERLDIEHFYSGYCSDSVFRDIYREYHDYLKEHRFLDFDDMMTYTYELFTSRPDILKCWQDKYRYILIDEFQDINQIQFDIVRMMAMPRNNLFIVGDDDQSIYRFRGSKPEIMLNFPKLYPDAEQILLDTNYRCDGKITEAAMTLISHNKMRFDKQVMSARKKTDSLDIRFFESEDAEYAYLAQLIKSDISKGNEGDASDYAVLFRTNTNPRRLMEQCLNYGVPFKSRDQIPSLYEHWVSKDVRTYIRLAAGSRSRADVLAVMNKPLRYLSRDSLTESEVAFDVWERLYDDKPWIQDRIIQLEQSLKMLSKMSPYAAVNYIRKGIGYDDYIHTFCEEKNLNEEELLDILDELQASAKGFQSFREWNDHILECEEAIAKMNKKNREEIHAVTFSTLHSAKGLEFNRVIIIDVNEGTIPYKKAVMEEEIEEERRLFYVGMTRAKDRLILCSVKNPHDMQSTPSRFLEELN